MMQAIPTRRYHIIINIKGVDNKILDDKRGLNKFLKELPGIIDMKILRGPIVAAGTSKNPGLSGFVIIDFSHISVHTLKNSRQALVDIFSCKPFRKAQAIKATLTYFKVAPHQYKVQEVCWGYLI